MPVHQSLLELIPPKLLPTVKAAGTTRPYADGQVIHTQQAASVGLSIILRGRVRFGLYAETGAFNLTGLLGCGHCFGEATLFADRRRAYHAEAFGETEVLAIGKRAFDALHDAHPPFARAVTVTVTQRLYEALDIADDLRRRGVEQQIAMLLLRIARTGGFDEDDLPLRQADIAFALGMSRVSIGKALDRLSQRDLIQLGYGKITMIDRQALLELGNAA
ncbi:MAG: Crp/Fnr family transcriptional regulator [Pseudomonadota bacterium]